MCVVSLFLIRLNKSDLIDTTFPISPKMALFCKTLSKSVRSYLCQIEANRSNGVRVDGN